MAVQVQVTWTFVGDDELELTSGFGHTEPVAHDEDSDVIVPAERVLESESSTLATGLALQLA
jgi:hypothetical protein